MMMERNNINRVNVRNIRYRLRNAKSGKIYATTVMSFFLITTTYILFLVISVAKLSKCTFYACDGTCTTELSLSPTTDTTELECRTNAYAPSNSSNLEV